MSRPAWVNVGGQDAVGSATVTASSDTLAITSHGLLDGDLVMVDTLAGGADGPLIEGAVYYVRNATTNDFQLSATSGGALIEFSADGTADVLSAVPSYSAQALRQLDSALLFPGVSDTLGARSGVRPHATAVVAVAGTTWTVRAHAGVVYPGLTSISGPYRYAHEEQSDSLDPADGSNDRIDALDLQIQDDDEDTSGFRRSRVVPVTGTPASSPVAPAVTANSLRLATILVPAGGSPSPTVQTLAQETVAAGGVLPVIDSTELPTAGRHRGMMAYRRDEDILYVWDGSAWQPIAGVDRGRGIVAHNEEGTSGDVAVSGSAEPGTLLVSTSATLSTTRRYRITGLARYYVSTTGVRVCKQAIQVDGTTVATSNEPISGETTSATTTIESINQSHVPSSSGSVSVELYGFRFSGATSLLARRTPAIPFSILVEDIGPA